MWVEGGGRSFESAFIYLESKLDVPLAHSFYAGCLAFLPQVVEGGYEGGVVGLL